MKKLFSLLTLALLTTSAWAAKTVTINFSEQGYANGDDLTTLTVDGVTLTFDKGTGSNAPKYYSSGTNARLYVGNTMKVAASEAITKIVFTCNENYYWGNQDTWSAGSYTDGTWTGSANEVTFTRVTSGQTRIQKMEITLGGEVVETVADPVFTPGDGTSFIDSQEIALTCGTTGATISYSTNGLTWETYTEPFTITESCTVYAKAAKNGVESNVVSANYTKVVPVEGNAVTFNSKNDKGDGSTERGEWTIVKYGVTMHCTDGTVYDDNYRIYQGAILSISTNETAGNIVKIEFDNTDTSRPISKLSTETGALTTEGAAGTWVGETDSVAFTASAQARASEIRVYVTGDVPVEIVVAAPTLPASCEFEQSMTVEITNNEEGATLMYALNDGEFTEYTQALNITETTTVHAKAVKGEKESTVVSATYTLKPAATTVATIAEGNVLADDTEFTFTGNAVVCFKNKKNMWVRDESGSVQLYGSANFGDEFQKGVVITPNWGAKKATYNGMPEYTDLTSLTASQQTVTVEPYERETLTMDNANEYVVLKNVTIVEQSTSGGRTNYTTNTGIVARNNFGVAFDPQEGVAYNLIGVVSAYNGNPQLYITEVEGYVAPIATPNDLAEANALTDNMQFTYSNDVAATYQNGKYLFIRDENGNSGLIFGEIDATFETGDVLGADWSATKTTYYGVREFIDATGVTNSGVKWEVAPYERKTLTVDNVNEYVIMKGLSVIPETDETVSHYNQKYYNVADSMMIYDQFGVNPTFVEGKTYDIVGIATIYNNKPQLYIISVTEVAVDVLRGDVDNSGDVTISDVTALIDALLSGNIQNINDGAADTNLDGEVGIGDVTVLIDFLLSGNWHE